MNDLAAFKDTFARYGIKALRHHAIIAILAALGVMILSAYTISQVIAIPDDEEYRAEKQASTVKTNFDKATIEKIDRLRDRQQSVTPDLPSGRINPFTE